MQIGLDQMDGGRERMRDHILSLVVNASLSKESQRTPGLWLQNPQDEEIDGARRMHENHFYMAGLGRLAPVFPFCPNSVAVKANILFEFAFKFLRYLRWLCVPYQMPSNCNMLCFRII